MVIKKNIIRDEKANLHVAIVEATAGVTLEVESVARKRGVSLESLLKTCGKHLLLAAEAHRAASVSKKNARRRVAR